jgi:hypothetical protein
VNANGLSGNNLTGWGAAGCSHSMPRGREARPPGGGTSQASGRPGVLRTTRPETIRIRCATGWARFAVGRGVTLWLYTYGLSHEPLGSALPEPLRPSSGSWRAAAWLAPWRPPGAIRSDLALCYTLRHDHFRAHHHRGCCHRTRPP